MADPVQLQQVFMNLMLNAIEAMKEGSGGSELTIKSEAEEWSSADLNHRYRRGIVPGAGGTDLQSFLYDQGYRDWYGPAH